MLRATRQLAPICLSLLFPVASTGVASGPLIRYEERATFEGTHPGLSVEDFEEVAVGNGSMTFLKSWLSPDGRVTFVPDLESKGVELRPDMSAQSMQLYVLGDRGFRPPTTSKVMGRSYFVDSLDIAFTRPTNVVGIDVSLLGANPGAHEITATVYGATGRLGEFLLNASSPASPSFFGVWSETPIARINLADAAAADSEIIDNIAFGWSPGPMTVPESVGWMALAIGLAGRLRCGRLSR